MRERALRAIAECNRIATMSDEPDRITRRFLSLPMRDVHVLLRSRMEMMGMKVHLDAAGNLRALWRPAGLGGKLLVLGSHIDTVPDAGAFDGVLGVTVALELVAISQELELPLAIEVIAFSDEEGVRFGVPFLGSRAVVGRFDSSLLALTDSDGTSVETAIRGFGLDPARIGEAALHSDAAAFLEIHIEQGPVMESEGLSIAAVSAIVGQTRLTLTFTGQANHAGTTPMRLRRDALAAAAEWITAVEGVAQRTDGLVATVGKIQVEPNASNVVPGAVQLSLDVRHANDLARAGAVQEVIAKAGAIAGRRGIAVAQAIQLDQPSARMDEQLTASLTASIAAAGFPPHTMSSGAGHDAMVMAARVPTAMLFLRSPGGISHHPAESVRVEDVEASLHVGREFLILLSKNIG
jgi:allantoate deiminase